MAFLSEPEPSPELVAKYDAEAAGTGFLMNLMHLWGHQPEAHTQLVELLGTVGSTFSFRERGIMITAAASSIGDSYCSLAWGWKLAAKGDEAAAVGVLSGSDADLTPKEAALAAWARRVGHHPSATTQADVQLLRDAGWSDGEIFRATVFVALRIAFSTVNGALGAAPDSELADLAPPEVRELVTWGRPIDGGPATEQLS